ncbi:hypothetical protein [Nioella sp. MMSF_3534]|uniref:hypothetical protein n=1 Tax=Nioella sp. MMSF_3534 TaxID=3046720 RepID=UPI00273FC9F4|nr:hypothetical protein [Nioella sp. MMSF_3534]
MSIGVQIRDDDGSLYFETSARVLNGVPDFAAKMGEVSAAWAFAEGHLGCVYAELLETTPEQAIQQLGKDGAQRLTDKARKFACTRLNDDDLASLIELLERMDKVRCQRNRVQHDLWSWRVGDNSALYAVHVDSYRQLLLEVIHNKNEPNGAKLAIHAADRYAMKAENRFTLQNLEELRSEIESVSIGLFEFFLNRVGSK